MCYRFPAYLSLLIGSASAAPALAHSDVQVWTTAVVNVRLGGPWRLNQDLTTRVGDHPGGLRELESNTLLGYALSKRVTVAAGYSHHVFYRNGVRSALDRRAREQISVDRIATLAGGTFNGRLRAEQRWRDGFDGTAWRLRPFVRYGLPIHGKTQLVLSHEEFLNLNTTAFQRRTGLERMRNFAGVSLPLNARLGLEAGYLNQHIFVRNGQDSSDHAASLTLTGNL